MVPQTRMSYTQMMKDLKSGIKKLYNTIKQNIEQILKDIDKSTQDTEEIISELKTNDLTVRSLGDALEGISVKILSLQQPVSRDLRMVLSSFRMIYDLERVSRNAFNAFVDLSKIDFTDPEFSQIQISLIKDSLIAAIKLLDNFNEIYQMEPVEGQFDYSDIVEESIELDNTIDHLFEKYSKTIIERANKGDIQPDYSHYLLSSIRSLERTGDHCCNLIERSIYIQTGDKIKVK